MQRAVAATDGDLRSGELCGVRRPAHNMDAESAGGMVDAKLVRGEGAQKQNLEIDGTMFRGNAVKNTVFAGILFTTVPRNSRGAEFDRKDAVVVADIRNLRAEVGSPNILGGIGALHRMCTHVQYINNSRGSIQENFVGHLGDFFWLRNVMR